MGCISPPRSRIRFSFHQMLWGYPKSDPGEDQYYLRCLGQMSVLLREQLISDLWHVTLYMANISNKVS